MRKLVIGGIPTGEQGIQITAPSQALTDVDNCWIDLSTFGNKNLEAFLKHYHRTVTVYAKRAPPQKIRKLFNKEERVSFSKKPGFGTVIKTVLLPTIPPDKKITTFKASGIAPRIILKLAVQRASSPIIVNRLLAIDRAGEPTYQALANIHKEMNP